MEKTDPSKSGEARAGKAGTFPTGTPEEERQIASAYAAGRPDMPVWDPDASPEEKILHRLIDGEQRLLGKLENGELRIVRGLLRILLEENNAARTLAVSRALKNVVAARAAVTHRLCEMLAATSRLCDQRRLLTFRERCGLDPGKLSSNRKRAS